MAETLVFLREFRSLTAGPAAHAELQEIPAAGSGNFFGSFREFLRSFGELRSVSCAPGAGRLAGVHLYFSKKGFWFYAGVWEFVANLRKLRSVSCPSYNPGTENTLLWPRSLVLQP